MLPKVTNNLSKWDPRPPFASKMTSKMDPKIIIIPTSVKYLFLQPLSSHMLVLRVPRTPESDLKSSKKVTWNKHPKKTSIFKVRIRLSQTHGPQRCQSDPKQAPQIHSKSTINWPLSPKGAPRGCPGTPSYQNGSKGHQFSPPDWQIWDQFLATKPNKSAFWNPVTCR